MNQTRRLAAILAADVRRSASGVTRQRRHRLGMAARHPAEPIPAAAANGSCSQKRPLISLPPHTWRRPWVECRLAISFWLSPGYIVSAASHPTVASGACADRLLLTAQQV